MMLSRPLWVPRICDCRKPAARPEYFEGGLIHCKITVRWAQMGAKPTKRLRLGCAFESLGELFKNMILCPLSSSLRSGSLWQGPGVATSRHVAQPRLRTAELSKVLFKCTSMWLPCADFRGHSAKKQKESSLLVSYLNNSLCLSEHTVCD